MPGVMTKMIGVTWPLVNKFLIVGSPDDRRTHLFQQALKRLQQPPATVIHYKDLHTRPGYLASHITADTILRIESPGKDWQANNLLLHLGATAATAEGLAAIRPPDHPPAKGWLYPTRQWYLGLCYLLQHLQAEIAPNPPPHIMNSPAAISTMFNKREIQSRLTAANLPVPPILPPITSYENLRTAMKAHHCTRVFIKPNHGSSAIGIVAYETNGPQHKATTTVEIVQQEGQPQLYNTRKLRIYRDEQLIATLINHLCQQHIHVEQWIPKAQLDGYNCDIRIVVIGGQARHKIVRLSHSPITNLHLLNERADTAALRPYISQDNWHRALNSCQQAAALLPDALYMGLDMLFTTNWQRHFILELNAFGDLLPTVRYNGLDTYETEITHLLQYGPTT